MVGADRSTGLWRYPMDVPGSFKWAIPGLFFFIFVFSIQFKVNVQYIFLLMTGFELWVSGFGSDRSTN